MKIPEFIPFKFDKFVSNLFRRQGAEGVGRWALLRKAVAETDSLSIDISDMIDCETLELDLDCTATELTEFLDYAAGRSAIDPTLWESKIIWIVGLEEDLTPFFRAGKRKIPSRPATSRKNSETSGQVEENFQDLPPTDGNFRHERTNERTNEQNERTNNCAHGVKIEEIDVFAKKTQAFIEAFGNGGNSFKTESAYKNAVIRLKMEGRTEKAAHELLIQQAAKDRLFCIQTHRRRRDPCNWLNDGDWSKDYAQELANHKEIEDQKTKTAKGGLKDGNPKSAARSYTDAAIEFKNAVEAQFED